MNRRSVHGLAAPITALVVCALALALAAAPALASKKPSAKQVANKVLKLKPRKPADINLFGSRYVNGGVGLYPSGSAMTPASGPLLTEQQVRNRLKTFLRAQFHKASRVLALGVFGAERSVRVSRSRLDPHPVAMP
jgi:hypothetical protein